MTARRLDAIDGLRGLVMVLMTLDHCRDYFGDFRVSPTDLATTTPALFFTRWVTHLCAPVFVFLAGTAAWFHGARERGEGGRRRLSVFLVTRGLWLVVLEATIVYFAWTNSFSIGVWLFGVIAVIGVAMMGLGALVHLPLPAVVGIGLLLTVGHNLLDPVAPSDLGSLGWLWILAHEGSVRSELPILLGDPGPALIVIYPCLPWIGVMALGYALGPLCARPREERRRTLLWLGGALTAAFVALRFTNAYGDPVPWVPQGSVSMTIAAFLNCEKYPPSLLYLLMTLGPALVLLALLDREPGPLGRVLATFGRVPLFYYVLHLYVIHLSSRLLYLVTHGDALSSVGTSLRTLTGRGSWPEWYGHDLPVVYAAWVLVVLVLYPLCAWYADVKRRSRSRLLSYV
jgi:uncharacterized membrane protein